MLSAPFLEDDEAEGAVPGLHLQSTDPELDVEPPHVEPGDRFLMVPSASVSVGGFGQPEVTRWISGTTSSGVTRGSLGSMRHSSSRKAG